jgi:hypothetical protein
MDREIHYHSQENVSHAAFGGCLLSAAFVCIAVVAAVVPNAAHAQNYFETGEKLLQYCKAATDTFAKGVCDGYITGVLDALEAQRFWLHLPSCLRKEPQVGETVHLFINAIEANPGFNSAMPAAFVLTRFYIERCDNPN